MNLYQINANITCKVCPEYTFFINIKSESLIFNMFLGKKNVQIFINAVGPLIWIPTAKLSNKNTTVFTTTFVQA